MKCIGLVAALGVAAGLAIPSSSEAADQFYGPTSAYQWSGYYLGINGGFASGDVSWTYDVAQTTANHSTSGALAGVTAGINFQQGPWVWGAEADADWAGVSGSTSCPSSDFTCKSNLEWLATLRGRLGYAQNNWLLYGTAGLAVGSVHAETVRVNGASTPPSGTATNGSTSTDFGWTAGVGAEVQLRDMWSAKFEWLYFDLGSSGHTIDNSLAVTVGESGNIFRAGLNRRF